jgi:molecular chaperone HscA
MLHEARRSQGGADQHDEVHIGINAAGSTVARSSICLTTRRSFAEITQKLVAKTIQPVKKRCATPGCRSDVKGVVMVGGATRMPHVQRAVGRFFGRSR